MLRATTIGLVSAVALGVSLAAPAYAMMKSGSGYSGGMHYSGMSHNYSQNMSPMMHTYHDHDHDGDHDHDRRHFRFFPSFAYIDTYADNYDPACWEVVRVKTRLGWQHRRIWVCDQTIY